jgi:thiol-disulfide isomerase/thioredoxin
MKRYIALVIVLAGVVGAIWYLEMMKVAHGPTGPAVPIAAGTHSANYEANSAKYPMAKEFVSPDGYINTPATTTLSYLVNNEHKVVLLDFWTYSCINCQRTIPYLEAWYQKYKDYGLVIVGVHSPEFEFEKVLANVEAGVKKFGITYPVVMDSAMGTWNAYNNQYWPEEYLIDTDGLVRENNIGEGNYEETEQNIQKLLNERNQTLGLTAPIPTGFVDVTVHAPQAGSPETYFGYERNQYLGNGQQRSLGLQTLTAPSISSAAPNTLYLGGTWRFQSEYAENTSANASIIYYYSAKNVYLVASSEKGVTLTIYIDGKLISAGRGADVDAKGQVHVQESRLYTLFQSDDVEQHVIQINVSGAGLDAYTFTFG